jgi:RNA polymerase sigma-70 factor (ECF subfamily)
MPSLLHASSRRAEATDAQLLQRVAGGELAPLGLLYDRHHNAVREFVARATRDAHDTDDITHEAFLALASVADRFDGRASARPLLVGIAAMLVRQRRRSVARLLAALAAFAGACFERQVRTPEDTASAAEEMERVERALARLSEEKRLVVLLVDGEGWKGEEAARALGVPLNTVWTRLHYGRRELRAELQARVGLRSRQGQRLRLRGRGP